MFDVQPHLRERERERERVNAAAKIFSYENLLRCYYECRRRKRIEKISQLFDKFKIRFRFAYEIGLMTDKKFGIAQKEMEEIGKMIGGWSRWTASRPTGQTEMGKIRYNHKK